jgi:hypothetical protein
MTASPAVGGKILRNFSIAAVTIVSAVYASDRIITIASQRQMMEARGNPGTYNDMVHPEQDRLYVSHFPYLALSVKFVWFWGRDSGM